MSNLYNDVMPMVGYTRGGPLVIPTTHLKDGNGWWNGGCLPT